MSFPFLCYLPNSNEIIKSKKATFFDKLPLYNKEKLFFLESSEESSFGISKRAYNHENEKNIILKTFDHILASEFSEIALSDAILEDYILNKVENLKITDYVLKYYGVFLDPEKTKSSLSSLIFQKEDGICSLEDIVNSGMVYEKENLKYVMTYLIKGLYILQKNGIAVRDVKLSNFVLVENEECNAYAYKIKNLSIGCFLFEGTTFIGNENISGCNKMYAAPEVERSFFNKNIKKNNKKDEYDPFKADAYSLGVCLLKLMGFLNPKQEINEGNLLKPEFLLKYQDFDKFLKNMLCEDPMHRYDFKQLWMLLSNSEDILSYIPKPPEKLYLEERKHFEKWRDDMERKRINHADDIMRIFYEHKNLFKIYSKSLKKQKESQYHFDKACSLFKEYKERLNTNNSYTNGATIETTERMDDKEEIFIFRERANQLRKNDEQEKAIEVLRDCLNICERIYKKSDSYDKEYMLNEDFANCFLQIAINYLDLGKEKEAEENCQQSLNLLLLSFGENNEKTAKAYAVLGAINEKNEEIEKAEEFYLKFLDIRKGENNFDSDIANVYNSLGGIYLKQENQEKAEEYYKKALDIRIKIYGTSHLDVANSYLNLGILYKEIWDFEKADEFFNEGKKIYEGFYGENNSKIVSINEALIDLYVIMGNIKKKDKKFKEAEEIYNKALKLAQNQNSIYCMVISENLKSLYLDGILENLEK